MKDHFRSTLMNALKFIFGLGLIADGTYLTIVGAPALLIITFIASIVSVAGLSLIENKAFNAKPLPATHTAQLSSETTAEGSGPLSP